MTEGSIPPEVPDATTDASAVAAPDTLGHRLWRMRTERHLTQHQLAGTQYTAAYVSSIETGRRQPSEAAIRYFADKLGVDADELRLGLPPNLPVTLELRLADARHAASIGELAGAEKEFNEVRRLAGAHGLAALEARAVVGIARIAMRTDVAAASRLADQADQLLADAPLNARVPVVMVKAECQRLSSDIRYGIYLVETTLDELERTGLADPDALVEMNGWLVQGYLDLGSRDRAAVAARTALALAVHAQDPFRLAKMHMLVARSLMAQRDGAGAERSLAKAHELFTQLDLRNDIGRCHWAMGYYHARQDKPADAERELRQALAVMDETADQLGWAGVVSELGDVLRKLGNRAEARELLGEAHRRLTQAQATSWGSEIDRCLGELDIDDGDLVGAEGHFRAAVAVAARSEQYSAVALAARLLGDTLSAMDRPDEARAAYREALVTLESALP
jgi:tetratricopeptide (TPR) repeat protein